MSLPQLIGLKCVICQKQVDSVREADFCSRCGNPVHNACLEHGDIKVSAGTCADCGGNPRNPVALEVRKERKLLDVLENQGIKVRSAGSDNDSGRTENIPEKAPVSKVCPKCGGTKYTKRKPRATVAFVFDRVCSDCGTRYAPPTPTWAGLVFLLAGLLLSIFGFPALILGLIRGDACAIPAMLIHGALGVMGLLALIFGIKSLANPGKM
jgi:hypothetical protein